MPKDKTVNPATAQLKADKARALKKGKATVAQQRQDRLATRNPERLQRQIEQLNSLKESQGGKLKPRDQNQLESLERDIKQIRKARDAKGIDDTKKRGDRDGGPPHKRARTGDNSRDNNRPQKRERDSDEESTDDEARNIPMPRDTPPPIPPRQRRSNRLSGADAKLATSTDPPAKKEVVKEYSGAAQVRDLRKEATKAFIPTVVAARLKQKQAMSGTKTGSGPNGRLLEPEEVDALEKGGYSNADTNAAKEKARAALQDKDKLDDDEAELLRELEQEEARHKLAQGMMEDGVEAAAEAEREETFARKNDEDQRPIGEPLAESILNDARMAASEAVNEELLGMVATGKSEPSLSDALAESTMHDGQKAAEEAAKEEMLGAEIEKAAPPKRRLVEIEDVSDEEW